VGKTIDLAGELPVLMGLLRSTSFTAKLHLGEAEKFRRKTVAK